jgi:hypothetical protein
MMEGGQFAMEHKPENYTLIHAYEQALQPPKDQKISSILTENIDLIKNVLRLSSDLVIREFHIARRQEFRAALIFFDEMINKTAIQDFVMKALMLNSDIPKSNDKKAQKHRPTEEAKILPQAYKRFTAGQQPVQKQPGLKKHIPAEEKITRANIGDYVEKFLLPAGQVKPINQFWETIDIVLSGQSILLIDGTPTAYVTDMQGWERRGVPDAVREASILGPNDAFNETLMTNMALIRRRIRDPRLAIKMHKVGVRTQTDTAILYLNGLANPSILSQIEEKIDSIGLDGVLYGRSISDFFSNRRFNIFPLHQTTERPDKAAGAILQGQFVILTDNAPAAIITPVVMASLFQSVDDYLFSPLATFFLRLVRTFGWLVALFLPALYVALTSVNMDVLPTELLLSVSRSREGVPYPPWVETVFLGVMTEMLIEASARLPGTIGPTATTVGGLIIGQAAAQAQLISNLMIIVAASTVIGSFTLPSYELSLAWRISQAALIPFAALFGIFGIVIAICMFIIYLCGLESFGVPYISPIAPLRVEDAVRDVLLRSPWNSMIERPQSTQALGK